MIDLSNNNDVVLKQATAFRQFYRSGQRRCYLKCSEGAHFRDHDRVAMQQHAFAAGFKVGLYHFARPHSNTVHAELENLLGALPKMKRGRDLRVCLDVEDGSPTHAVSVWVQKFCKQFQSEQGYQPLIYGSYWYLSTLDLPAHKDRPLWLAWYTRDGQFHGTTNTPRPWRQESALQWSQSFHFPWMPVGSHVDISHVFIPGNLELPRLRRLRAAY